MDVRGGRAKALPPRLVHAFNIGSPTSTSTTPKGGIGISGGRSGVTILDGELVENNPHNNDSSSKEWLFLVFDSVVLGGFDIGAVEHFGFRLAHTNEWLLQRGAFNSAPPVPVPAAAPPVAGVAVVGVAAAPAPAPPPPLRLVVKSFVAAQNLEVLRSRLQPLLVIKNKKKHTHTHTRTLHTHITSDGTQTPSPATKNPSSSSCITLGPVGVHVPRAWRALYRVRRHSAGAGLAPLLPAQLLEVEAAWLCHG